MGRLSEQGARQPGQTRGHGIDQAQPARHRRADLRHARRILAIALQRQAEGRVDNAAHQGETDEDDDQDIDERRPPQHVEGEAA